MSVRTEFESYVDQLVDCGLDRGLALALAEQTFLFDRGGDPVLNFEIKYQATLARIRWGTKRLEQRFNHRFVLVFAIYAAIWIAAQLISQSG